jgi:hypothetical protein
VPPDDEGRRLSQAAPSTTPTAATTSEIAVTIPDRGDADAAEQLAWEAHLAELCPDDCPWCAGGRWAG